MRSIFSRLYTYRERPSVAPLENFLTEAFADLVNRLPLSHSKSLFSMLLPIEYKADLLDRLAEVKRLEMATQVSAALDESTTRPDMALYADEHLILAIEAKVFASVQQHRLTSADDDTNITLTRNQLETYAVWVGEHRRGEWPGAIVFLTGGTDPPNDFLKKHNYSVIRSVRSWRDVGDWILDNVQIQDRSLAYCVLALEFYQFLKEQGLMTRYVSSRDLAATMLFLPASKALHTTFMEAIKGVATHAPKLRGSRRMKAEFWAEANGYWGWFHFAQSVKRPRSKPYVAVGICFETGGLFSEDAAKLPLHEPFLFVFCADDWDTETPSVFLKSIPEGWIQLGQDQWIISSRALREFSADPDIRFDELKVWANLQIDRLTKCIPGYDQAPVEAAPNEDEEEVDA